LRWSGNFIFTIEQRRDVPLNSRGKVQKIVPGRLLDEVVFYVLNVIFRWKGSSKTFWTTSADGKDGPKRFGRVLMKENSVKYVLDVSGQRKSSSKTFWTISADGKGRPKRFARVLTPENSDKNVLDDSKLWKITILTGFLLM